MDHTECFEAVKKLADEIGLENDGYAGTEPDDQTTSVNEVYFPNGCLAVVTTLNPEVDIDDEHYCIELYIYDTKTKQAVGQIYPEDFKSLKLPKDSYTKTNIEEIKKCFEIIKSKSRESLEKRMF